jgi:hypothetical protein
MHKANFGLEIASQAKPFPYGPLATAIYINNAIDKSNPAISIVSKSFALHDEADSSSTAKLIRHKE